MEGTATLFVSFTATAPPRPEPASERAVRPHRASSRPSLFPSPRDATKVNRNARMSRPPLRSTTDASDRPSPPALVARAGFRRDRRGRRAARGRARGPRHDLDDDILRAPRRHRTRLVRAVSRDARARGRRPPRVVRTRRRPRPDHRRDLPPRARLRPARRRHLHPRGRLPRRSRHRRARRGPRPRRRLRRRRRARVAHPRHVQRRRRAIRRRPQRGRKPHATRPRRFPNRRRRRPVATPGRRRVLRRDPPASVHPRGTRGVARTLRGDDRGCRASPRRPRDVATDGRVVRARRRAFPMGGISRVVGAFDVGIARVVGSRPRDVSPRSHANVSFRSIDDAVRRGHSGRGGSAEVVGVDAVGGAGARPHRAPRAHRHARTRAEKTRRRRRRRRRQRHRRRRRRHRRRRRRHRRHR